MSTLQPVFSLGSKLCWSKTLQDSKVRRRTFPKRASVPSWYLIAVARTAGRNPPELNEVRDASQKPQRRSSGKVPRFEMAAFESRLPSPASKAAYHTAAQSCESKMYAVFTFVVGVAAGTAAYEHRGRGLHTRARTSHVQGMFPSTSFTDGGIRVRSRPNIKPQSLQSLNHLRDMLW